MGKQYKPAKYYVNCAIHGRENKDKIKELSVGRPRNKREKIGCPLCRKESVTI